MITKYVACIGQADEPEPRPRTFFVGRVGTSIILYPQVVRNCIATKLFILFLSYFYNSV